MTNRIFGNQNINYVTVQLKEQMTLLHNVLEFIESNNGCREQYIIESIKTVENKLRQLRIYIND